MHFQPIQTTDDIRKLQSEMLQARNQQFALGTAALTISGLSAWLSSRPAAEGSHPAAASLGLLVLLWLMLRWTRTLWILITIISRYLELRGASEWEGDFREFIQPNSSLDYRSQSHALALLYLVLGVLVPVHHVSLCLGPGRSLALADWAVVGAALAYLGFTVYYVFGPRPEAAIVARWREVLARRHPIAAGSNG